MISDSKYYDQEQQVVISRAPYVGLKDAAENIRLYKEWDKLDSAGRETFVLADIEGRSWLRNVSGWRTAVTGDYLASNPDIEALLQVTNFTREPRSGRATRVRDIIVNHNTGVRRMEQNDIMNFLNDVITGSDLTKYIGQSPLTIS